jgi:hypothetical protein
MQALRRAAVLALLGLTLAAPWAAAAEARTATPPQESTSAARAAFDLVASWGRLFTSFWVKSGCTADPLGLCSPQTPTTKEGCTMDPLGACATGSQSGTQAPTSDSGCTADPLGGCAPGH